MNTDRLQQLGTVCGKEYFAGIISGIGLGIIVDFNISSQNNPANHHHFPLNFLAYSCIVAGSFWARAIQQKRLAKDKFEKESGISS